MNNKGTAHLGLIIIIVILIAVAGYLLLAKDSETKDGAVATPTLEPTTNETKSEKQTLVTVWKTYINEEYDFILEYPEHWELEFEKNNLKATELEEQFGVKPIFYEPFESCGGRLSAYDHFLRLYGKEYESSLNYSLYFGFMDLSPEYDKVYFASIVGDEPDDIEDLYEIDFVKFVEDIENKIDYENPDDYWDYEFTSLLGGNARHSLPGRGGGPCDVNFHESYEVISNNNYISIGISQTDVLFEDVPYRREILDKILDSFDFTK